MSDFQITFYNPNNGIAVAERKDGRQYDVEIHNGKVFDVRSVGGRNKSSVLSFKIGQNITEVVSDMLTTAKEPFFLFGGFGGEIRKLA